MATSVTTQSTVATGDTIEAAYSNTSRDNAAVLDVRTGGDPGGAGKILVSSGALGSAWLAPGAAGLPLVSNSTAPDYAKLGTAGIENDAITAALIAAGVVGSSELAPGAAVANI